jgi:hypothetical protein
MIHWILKKAAKLLAPIDQARSWENSFETTQRELMRYMIG